MYIGIRGSNAKYETGMKELNQQCFTVTRNKLLLITTHGVIFLLNLRRLVFFSLRLGCIIYSHTVHVNDGCHVQVQPDVIISDDSFISLKFIFVQQFICHWCLVCIFIQ